jgi:glycosyltransferase involved in cell wall biosynthesis
MMAVSNDRDLSMTVARPHEGPSGSHTAARPATWRSYPFVSIVMPCLNEHETVGTCVRKALAWLAGSGVSGEVIVVDNGSTDGSAELAGAEGARVVHEMIRGYGAALRRGFAEARGEWIVMGDCDDTYDFSQLTPLMQPLVEGYDMAVGNRFTGGIAPGAMTWSHRYIGTPAISALLKVFTGLKVGDSQCGLRAFTREALERMDLRTDGMELASEMILKSARRGLRVADVPAPYAERLGEAKLDTMRDGWRHLRFLLLASPNYLFTLPGILLTLLGIITLGMALPQHGIEIGDMTWQPIFAGGIFLVAGVNALLLGFAARIYTTGRGITNEDWGLRFYYRHLGLERTIGFGIAAILLGGALDLMLAISTPENRNISRLDVAAIAQALVLVGINVVLVGAMASLLEGD